MKTLTFFIKPTSYSRKLRFKKISVLLIIGFTLIQILAKAQVAPNLGEAGKYALLADSIIFLNDTIIVNGNVGSNDSIYPSISTTDSIWKNGGGTVPQALIDLDSAIQFCKNQTSLFISNPTVGGLSLTQNIYSFSGLTSIDGILTLVGDTNSVFIFILDSLNIQQNASISTSSGVQPHNIYWIINDYINISDNASFVGTILSVGSIYCGAHNDKKTCLLSLKGSINIDLSSNTMGQLFYSWQKISNEDLLILNAPLCISNLFACDYINDGDFEQYKSCPSYWSEIWRTCWWHNVGAGSSDYFNSCSTSPACDVPSNAVGNQANYPTGNGGYGGIILKSPYDPSYNSYREYIYSPLLKPLVPGYYYGEVKVVLADQSAYAVDGLGICYSSNIAVPVPGRWIIQGLPTAQISNQTGNYLNQKNVWTTVSGCFNANGGERYITIGNFNEDANTLDDPANPYSGNVLLGSYLIVDHVSTIKLPDAGLNITSCNSGSPIIIGDNLSCLTSGFTYSWTSIPYDATLYVGGQNLTLHPTVYPTQQTTYTLTCTSSTYCNFTTSCTVYINPSIVFSISGAHDLCPGSSEILDAGFGYSNYHWSTGASTQSINISTTGTYIVTVTNSGGCTGTASCIINQGHLPAPIIEGDLSLCRHIDNLWNFNISNGNPNYQYTWSFSPTPSAISYGLSNTSAFVQWLPFPPSAASIVVTAYDPVSGCEATSTYCLQECCESIAGSYVVIPPDIDYTTFNSLYCSSPGVYNDPTPTIFNGILRLTGPMTFNNCHLFFGPGAKIIVDGQTLNGTSTIFSACSNKMWAGIEIMNSANLILLDAVINDAQYGVKVLDDSQYDLKVTYFNRNYIGVYIPPSSTPHLFPGTMDDVHFDCGGNLLYNYLCQNPTLETKTYAGIFASDVVDLQVTAPYLTSIPRIYFTNLNIGIKTIRTNVTVRNSYFENVQSYDNYFNIQDEGTGIYCEGDGGNFLLDDMGLGKTNISPTFFKVRRGIISIGMNSVIVQNKMEKMNLGVRIQLSSGFTTDVSSNTISYSATGISLQNNGASNGIGIYDNFITNDGASSSVGINVDEFNFPSYVGIFIGYNEIFMTSGQIGIRINSVIEPIVNSNYVTILSGLINNGIHLSNCDGALVDCNHVTGYVTTPISSADFGLHATSSINSSFTCNTVDYTKHGIEITGQCGGTFLSGNSMDHHDIGLFYSTTSNTGTQLNRGNLWLQGSYTYWGAKNENTSGFNLSTYFVTPFTANPTNQLKPPNRTPSLWFQVSSSGSAFSCAGSGPGAYCGSNELIAGGLDENDYNIAAGNTLTSEYQEESEWMADRYLYDKLTGDSSLIIPNTVIDTFYRENSNSSFVIFNSLNDSLEILMKSITNKVPAWKIINDSIKNIRRTILQYDSILRNGDINYQDSILIATTNQIYRENLYHYNHLRDSIIEYSNESRLEKIGQINLINNTLPANTVYEINEKTINDIYLNTIAKGIINFTPEQTMEILQIASQCPLSGGLAVFKARSLYIMINDTLGFKDEEICIGEGLSYKEGYNGSIMDIISNVYPSPSSYSATLKYLLSDNNNATFTIYNIYGQIIQDYIISYQNSEFSFATKKLPNGIYFYKICSDSNKQTGNGKFIVNR
jgi:hypothetical protein